MVGMNVSMPETLRDWVQDRITDGFGSVSEYVRSLIRADQRRVAGAETESILARGLADGRFDRRLVEDAFEELRALRNELRQEGSTATHDEIRRAIDEGRA